MTRPRTTRRATVVGLGVLAFGLSGGPVSALEAPTDSLTTTVATATQVTDPVTSLVSPSPSPTRTTAPAQPAPLPKPVKDVVEAVVERPAPVAPAPPAAPKPTRPVPVAPAPGVAPVSGKGSAPRPVAAPGSAAAGSRTGAAPATAGGTGAASLGSLGSPSGLSVGSGLAAAPPFGAPMVASAPGFTLPGLTPLPEAAPAADTAELAAAPRGTGTPAGLPGVVLTIAVVAAGAAVAGQVAELRRRRTAAVAA